GKTGGKNMARDMPEGPRNPHTEHGANGVGLQSGKSEAEIRIGKTGRRSMAREHVAGVEEPDTGRKRKIRGRRHVGGSLKPDRRKYVAGLQNPTPGKEHVAGSPKPDAKANRIFGSGFQVGNARGKSMSSTPPDPMRMRVHLPPRHKRKLGITWEAGFGKTQASNTCRGFFQTRFEVQSAIMRR
ncbi:hypothetical protein KI387_005569, partial [Taxus chinensis]